MRNRGTLTGAAALLDDLPNAQWLLGDRGYTRYDRCPTVFLAAVTLAATVIFWL